MFYRAIIKREEKMKARKLIIDKIRSPSLDENSEVGKNRMEKKIEGLFVDFELYLM